MHGCFRLKRGDLDIIDETFCKSGEDAKQVRLILAGWTTIPAADCTCMKACPVAAVPMLAKQL